MGQEPVLFNMSIYENIRLGKLDATAAEVEAAAKEAHAYEFISSMSEKGFSTEVGVKGSKLSGGQKQRIAIARAIIKKPQILLLDEATSALDNASEEIVLRTLNDIHSRQGMTMVSVAQKLSTIRGSNKIVVLRNGRVEEEGTHESLLALDGLYAQMCSAQVSEIEKSAQLEQEIQAELSQGTKRVDHKEVASEEPEISVIKEYPLLRIVKAMTQYWPLLLAGTLATLVAGCMFPALGYFVGKLSTYICGSSGGTMEHNVRKISIWMLIFSVITFVSFSVLGWAFGLMSSRIVKSLREECFWKLLHIDAQYFDSGKRSNLLAQSLNSDAEKTNDAGGPLFATMLMLIVAYIATVVLCFFWQWKLTLVIAVVIPLQSFCLIRCWMVHLAGPTNPQYQEAASLAQDAILNLKTLRACEGQEELERRYDEYLQVAFRATDEDLRYNSLWYGVGIAALFAGFAVSFWYGGYLEKFDEASDEDVNIVTCAAFMTALGLASTSLFAPGLAEGTRAAGRIYAMIDYKPSIDVLSSEGVTSPIAGKVEFKDVSFRYAGRENMVLQRVNLELPQGQQLGLTGPSGSGKTTITQLLLRLYDPTEGQILIDGVDIRKYNLKYLRAHIAFVGQEPVLFSGTVRSNVDFGLNKADEDIRNALKQAALPKFAEELDMEVGSRGSAVSGGQKQRIAIARAILRDPRILLLDEATSALDSKTEAKILKVLETAVRGRTVLVVAHRLSTIERCQQILVLEAGQVVERGSHQELRALGGVYAKLLKLFKT